MHITVVTALPAGLVAPMRMLLSGWSALRKTGLQLKR